jgi:flagellar motor protein MotB
MYVEDLNLVPLLFTFSYTFPLPKGFGIQPEVGLGAVLYKVYHYPTEADYHAGNLKETFTQNLLVTLRANAIWEVYRVPILSLHVGGGVDMIPEAEGPFFIPVIEAGVTFKPRLPRRISPLPSYIRLTGSPPPQTPAPDLREALKDDQYVAVEEVPKGIKITVWNIHFIEGTDVIMPSDIPRLNMIAGAIKQIPEARKIQVDGHVAAEGFPEAEMDLSFWQIGRAHV